MWWTLQHVTWTTQWEYYFEGLRRPWICLPVLHHLICLSGLALLAQSFLWVFWSTFWIGLILHDYKWDQWLPLLSTTPCGLCMDPLYSKVRRKKIHFHMKKECDVSIAMISVKNLMYLTSVSVQKGLCSNSNAWKRTFSTFS